MQTLAATNDIDARKATQLARDYFVEIHGNWMLMFKVENVEKNTDPPVWKVSCSFFTSPGQSKPLNYLVKVNVKDGKILEVKETKQDYKLSLQETTF